MNLAEGSKPGVDLKDNPGLSPTNFDGFPGVAVDGTSVMCQQLPRTPALSPPSNAHEAGFSGGWRPATIWAPAASAGWGSFLRGQGSLVGLARCPNHEYEVGRNHD